MKMEDLQPGQHFIMATKGKRGHFAREMWMNNTAFSDVVFPEPWCSDPVSFGTREEAIKWAKQLAEANNLPYIE